MSRSSTPPPDTAQLMLFAAPEVVRLPDGTFNVRPSKPVVKCSVRQAARITGTKRCNIYKLIEAGMIEFERPSPRKLLVFLESLTEHLAASKQADYWTADRRLKYFGKK